MATSAVSCALRWPAGLSVRAKNEEEEGKWPREKGDQHSLIHVSWVRGWEEGGVDTAKQEVAARTRALAALPLPTGRGTG